MITVKGSEVWVDGDIRDIIKEISTAIHATLLHVNDEQLQEVSEAMMMGTLLAVSTAKDDRKKTGGKNDGSNPCA